MDREQALRDVAAAIRGREPRRQDGHRGFCLGGPLAWSPAGRLPGLSAAVGCGLKDQKPKVATKGLSINKSVNSLERADFFGTPEALFIQSSRHLPITLACIARLRRPNHSATLRRSIPPSESPEQNLPDPLQL